MRPSFGSPDFAYPSSATNLHILYDFMLISGTLKLYVKNFISLVYPETCCACGRCLTEKEVHLCIVCRATLPQTRFHKNKENQLSRIFWGRQPIETGTALYFFHKKGKVQRIIHQFKYKGNVGLGQYLGKTLGLNMMQSDFYSAVNCVIPVPLHPDKERKRGFNQSAVIAEGIANSMDIEFRPDLLIRTKHTETQTKKDRYHRWQNVSSVFETPHPDLLEQKSVLLVDDVITTGATMEACIEKLLQVKGVKVWIATLAITD